MEEKGTRDSSGEMDTYEIISMDAGSSSHGMMASSGMNKTENHNATAPASPVTKAVSHHIGKGSKKITLPPPPRATPSSSSGYPGVSWNKRMGAWLSFYYDCDTRRSRTFHPKYYEFDVEKAKQAAIEFMKTIENHPRCSLRKTKKENKNNPTYGKPGSEMDPNYMEITSRNRKRVTSNHIGGMEYKTRNQASPLSYQNTQTSMSESYDLDALKRQFHINSGMMEPCFINNTQFVETDNLNAQNSFHESNYLSGSFESQQDFDKFYQTPTSWASNKKTYGQEYYIDTQKYSMPFLEGDVFYPSPNSSVYDGEMILTCNCGQARPPMGTQKSQSHASHPQMYDKPDLTKQIPYIANQYEQPSNMEDPEIHMIMNSIALSPNDSLEGFRVSHYDYGDGSGSYASVVPQFTSSVFTPLGSPYLSPYEQQGNKHKVDEVDLNKNVGFQGLMRSNDLVPQNKQASRTVN